ncbi:LPXTG-domain-containing protein cell wall anchor domain [Enterococcus silesiacus]|nr:LPXTG-domain-containing protein cell wall anchor domain [Enterococcus silesiacus]
MMLGIFHSAKAYANGGEVTVDGVIGFYEESVEPTITSTSTSENPIVKPEGKYPSTGELVKKSLPWLGGLLIIIAVVVWFKFRNSKEEKNEKN